MVKGKPERKLFISLRDDAPVAVLEVDSGRISQLSASKPVV
jgi:hypothetical protein